MPERILEQAKRPRPQTYEDCVRKQWYLFNQDVEKVTEAANKHFEERKGPPWLDKSVTLLEKINKILELLTGEEGEIDPGDGGESWRDLINMQARIDEIEAGTKKAADSRDKRIETNCKKP